MTRPLLLIIALSACQPRPRESRYAVSIFAEDTVPAHITVTTTGEMRVSLTGSGFYMRADQSVVVITPASLVVRGVGSAVVASLDSSRPLAVVPDGTRADSVDAVALVGTVVKLTRADPGAAMALTVEKP
jgi:hypothetical protein